MAAASRCAACSAARPSGTVAASVASTRCSFTSPTTGSTSRCSRTPTMAWYRPSRRSFGRQPPALGIADGQGLVGEGDELLGVAGDDREAPCAPVLLGLLDPFAARAYEVP